MQVKQRLRLNVVFSAILALIIFSVVSLALYRIEKANEKAKIAGDIITASFERLTFRNDYIRNSGERAKAQWFAKHAEIGRMLTTAAAQFQATADKAIIDELLKSHESVGRLFSAFVTNREKKGESPDTLDSETEDRLLSQLNMRIYDIVIDARSLLLSSREARDAALKEAVEEIAIVLALVVLAALLNARSMNRSIAGRVDRLRDGAGIIGSGDLDQRIEMAGKDEFTELADAFNEMTAKLRSSYKQLYNEVEERKQAEEKLQTANADLVNSRRAAINLLEDALTARRHAEGASAALRESEEQFRTLAESIPNLAWWANGDGYITWYNQRWYDYTGTTPDQMEGWGWQSVHDPEALPKVVERWKESLSTGKPFDMVFPLRGADGIFRPFLTRVMPVFDQDGRIARWFGTNTDISEQKRAEDALQKAHTELALQMEERVRELREKEVLLKEVHHRVKNNLQVISSLVGMQAEGTRDETVREVLEDVTYRVRSMALVHEKLYQSESLASINFAEYTRSLLNYLWRAHGSAVESVGLTLDLEPVSLPVDTAIPCGLILNELAGNALKHAFRGRTEGEVTVTLHEAGDGRISLSVGDDGVGFPAGFDWQQAGSLGLRLVQMLAGQLRADVTIGSEGGTRFEITFSHDLRGTR